MTIEDLGNFAEVAGAIATIATLAYLAIQIRANTRATVAEARRTTLHHRTSGFSELIADGEVALIFEKGLADRESLSSTERLRFDFLLSRLVADSDLLVLERRDGFAEAETTDPNIATTKMLMSTPGGREFWKQWRGSWSPEFQKLIDNSLNAK